MKLLLKPRSTYTTLLGEVLIYFNIAMLTVNDYIDQLDRFIGVSQHEFFRDGTFVQSIARGDGIDPYRTRLLVPWMLVAFERASRIVGTEVSLAFLVRLLYVSMITTSFLAIRRMLCSYGFHRSYAIAGTLMFSALLPIAMRDHGFQAWSWMEMVLLPFAITLLVTCRSRWLLVLVVLLSALNRETSLVLPLIAFAIRYARRGQFGLREGWVNVVVTTIIIVPTRLFLSLVWPGAAHTRELDLATIREWNLEPDRLHQSIVNISLLMGGLVVVAICAVLLGSAQREASIVAVFGTPLLLFAFFRFALWNEVRVLIPIAILVLPIGLGGIFPGCVGSREV